MTIDPHGAGVREDRSHATAAEFSQPGLARSSWRGAKQGFRRSAYIAAPIAVLLTIPGLIVTLFAAGSGRGWGLPGFLLAGWAVCSGSIFAGCLVGATFGLLRAVFRRAVPIEAGSVDPATAEPGTKNSRSIQAEKSSIDVRSRRRSRTLLRCLAGAFGVIVLLVFALAFILGAYVGDYLDQKLASAAAVAKQDDPNWQIEDVLTHRTVLAEAENSALVVRKAAELLPKHGLDGLTPIFVALRKNRDLVTATPDDVRLDHTVADTLRGELQACRESVTLARSLVNYLRGGYDLKLGPTVYDTPLPGLDWVRMTTSLMIADSAIRADDEDPDGALDSCLAIFAAARSIGDEPFCISQLSRISSGTAGLKATRRVLAGGEASDQALAKVQAVVLDELPQPFMLYALRGERASLVEIMRRFGAGELSLQELSNDNATFDPDAPRDVVMPWAKLWYQLQQLVALTWMNDVVNIEHQAFADRTSLWGRWANRLEVKQDSIKFWLILLPLELFPGVQAAALAAAQHRADLGATAILLAAERHRRKMGEWPESIAAIDKEILPEAPMDPFTDRPFRFERREGELLIYSVGANLKDDKGERDRKTYLSGGPDDLTARAWDVTLRRRPPTRVQEQAN